MARYIALIDGRAGAYGVVFPVFPVALRWERRWTMRSPMRPNTVGDGDIEAALR